MKTKEEKIIKIETDMKLEYVVSFSKSGEVKTTLDVRKAKKYTNQGARTMATKIRSHGEFCIVMNAE